MVKSIPQEVDQTAEDLAERLGVPDSTVQPCAYVVGVVLPDALCKP